MDLDKSSSPGTLQAIMLGHGGPNSRRTDCPTSLAPGRTGFVIQAVRTPEAPTECCRGTCSRLGQTHRQTFNYSSRSSTIAVSS
ncbi:hypothetical protein PGTUg99_029220 [Puccinia graminis f. sp. tritici]|uniref:Uncharacterized protein n=1 Tax=Puccinia graminis f. sp. tritici TaxID=56615 RepID=A0A5B0PJG8_PUCGR|nr:hypothetical protein PGTUg99_029220 [Puccinia graminis f. sp. tritici]